MSKRGELVRLIASPKKDAAVAGDSGAAAGAGMDGKHALFVQAGHDGGAPGDDLLGGANAKLAALVAAPRVPNAG
jgi:hypothetical protein